jgi:hypothetical protein
MFFSLSFCGIPVPVYIRIDSLISLTDIDFTDLDVVVISVVDTSPLAWTSFMEA